MNEQSVLICEHVSKPVTNRRDGDSIILEGIFAEFGIENNNGRIYEEEEYVPHLTYLVEKINTTKLLGELDHPDKFDISLDRVSHVVEHLALDKSSRTVRGRVRLLPTEKGEIARKLVEAGIPLNISSRAAGTVNENKRVKIQHIVTYDLVANPGFAKAQLNQIFESQGVPKPSINQFRKQQNEMLYESVGLKYNEKNKKELVCLNESLDIKSPNLFIYSVGEQAKNENEYINENDKNKSNKDMTPNTKSEYVTPQQFSIVLKSLNEKLKSYDETFANFQTSEVEDLRKQIAILEQSNLDMINKFNKLVSYAEKIASDSNKNEFNINKLIKHSDYLVENLESITNYLDHVGGSINENFKDYEKYLDVIQETTNKSIGYQEYIAGKLTEAIQYAESIGMDVNNVASYASDYLREEIENHAKHKDYIATKLNEAINYNEYQARQTGKLIDFADELAKKQGLLESYTENVLAENLNNAIGYTQYVADNSLPKVPQGHLTESEKLDKHDKILSKLDSIKEVVAKVKNNDVDVRAYQNKAMALMSESNRRRFVALPSTDKEKVLVALNESNVFTEQDVLNIWESAITESEDLRPHIKFMPDEIKPIWESLNQVDRNLIDIKAKHADLSSPTKCRMFWFDQGLVQNKNGFTPIQESFENSPIGRMIKESQAIYSSEAKFGISPAEASKIAEQIKASRNS